MIKDSLKYEIIIIVLLFFNTTLGIIGFAYSQTKKQVDSGFYLNGKENIKLEFGQKYEEAGFIANIDNKSHVKDVIIDSNININEIGDYEITYTLKYKSFSKTLSRKVKISDHTFPTLSIKCDTNLYVALNSNLPKCDVKAIDNYDKDITDKIIVDSNLNLKKIGDYKITYTVTDSSNNRVTKTINVHVRQKNELNYIKVTISKQKLEYFVNKKLVFSTPVTTGRHNNTKTGNFKILNKERNTQLKGADYVSFVQYWMGYGGGYGLHDASWRRRFGTQDYTVNGSHGCINLPTNAAKKLYSMVEVGTPLYIRK